MPPSNQQAHAVPAKLRVLCPHCNEPIDLSNVVAPPNTSNTQNTPETTSPFLMLGRASSCIFVKHLFPVGSVFASSKVADIEDRVSWPAAIRSHWKFLIAFVAGIVMICLLLMFWGKPQVSSSENVAMPESINPASTASAQRVDEATKPVILETLAQYNRAETEAGALLTMTPLEPLLVPDGPLAERRSKQVAERQQRKAPHRTLLLRWSIGEVRVSGDTAKVITQETWSNQEADAIAPEQATVRVTYTMHWDQTKQRWLIVDSNQMPL